MSYEIEVVEITGVDDRGYDQKQKVYTQRVEKMDLVAVIEAVNQIAEISSRTSTK